MDVTSLDRIGFRDSLHDMVSAGRPITVLIPTLTNISATSFDADVQTGTDSMSGNGTGRTATWTVYELRGFLKPINQALVTYGQVPPGVESGDMVMTARLLDQEVLLEAYRNEYHYIYIDGETFRITTTVYSGIGQVDEVIVGCRKFNPAVFRCAGY
jgi:hypothetical protein